MRLPSVLVMERMRARTVPVYTKALFLAPATYKKQGLGTRLELYMYIPALAEDVVCIIIMSYLLCFAFHDPGPFRWNDRHQSFADSLVVCDSLPLLW